MMGNKAKARQMMLLAGVPVVPGVDGTLEDFEHAVKAARTIGYPVMLKASAGGAAKA
jgi:acetyl-CoA carboxylase biotin carboxylase subunit